MEHRKTLGRYCVKGKKNCVYCRNRGTWHCTCGWAPEERGQAGDVWEAELEVHIKDEKTKAAARQGTAPCG